MPELRNATLWLNVEEECAKLCRYGEVPVWVKMSEGRPMYAEIRLGDVTIAIRGTRRMPEARREVL